MASLSGLCLILSELRPVGMSASSSIYHNRGDVAYVVVNRTWSEFALSEEVLVTKKRTYVRDLLFYFLYILTNKVYYKRNCTRRVCCILSISAGFMSFITVKGISATTREVFRPSR